MANEQVPHTQTAIVADGHGGLAISTSAPVPTPRDDEVLVRTAAVALNPVDSKTRAPPFGSHAGCFCGTDWAGTVVSAPASRPDLRPGDRVLGIVHGMHAATPRAGAFAQYVAAVGHLVLRVPDRLPLEQAAAMGTAIATVGLALFGSLRVPGFPGAPVASTTNILVYGGSSATGTMAIQMAKLCGLTVLTTCSPANFALVRAYGADHVYDYRSATAIADIKRQTGNALKLALDCISAGATMEFCYGALGRTGGRYTRLEPYPDAMARARPNVVADWVLAPLLAGRPVVSWPAPFARAADPEAKALAVRYFAAVQVLLDEGRLRPHPVRVADGFADILTGLDELAAGRISGEKLVVRIS